MEHEVYEEFGLETAWLDDRPNTISIARSYLEKRNFLIHVSTNIEEAENWIFQNGYDLLLIDLNFDEGERDGADLIQELRDSEKSIVTVPVSAFLTDYKNSLPMEIFSRAIDKASLGTEDGLEEMRKNILSQTKGGKIRVIERCFGFVEEVCGDDVIVGIEMPDKTVEKRIFSQSILNKGAIGNPSRFLEVTTVERKRGNGISLATVCKWLTNPEKFEEEN